METDPRDAKCTSLRKRSGLIENFLPDRSHHWSRMRRRMQAYLLPNALLCILGKTLINGDRNRLKGFPFRHESAKQDGLHGGSTENDRSLSSRRWGRSGG